MSSSLKLRRLCGVLLLLALLPSLAFSLTPSGSSTTQTKPKPPAQPSSAKTALKLPVPKLPIEVKVEQNRLLGQRGGATVWALELPESAAPIPQPVLFGNTAWVAWGPILRGVRLETGRVVRSLYLPARIVGLEPSDEGVALEVAYPSADPKTGQDIKQRFSVRNGVLEGRAVYLPTLEETGALEKLATGGLGFNPLTPETNLEAGAMLERRLKSDPLNPFLHLYLGRALQREGLVGAALEQYRASLTPSVPFFVSIRLARLLDGFGYADLADRALSAARSNWTALGYSPELPVSSVVLRTYGNPLNYALELDRAGANLRRDTWFRFLRDLAPRFEGFETVYNRYADALSAQGREGEALEWRAFASQLNRGSLYSLGPVALDRVRDVARLSILTLLLALFLVLLSLGLRYSRQQRQALSKLGGLLRAWWLHPLSRLRHAAFSYYTFSEKLVLLTLLVAVGVGLSALGWAVRTQSRAADPALNLGTLGGPWFYARLERLSPDPNTPETALLEGLATQLDGDSSAARARYAQTTQPLAALENNLGILEAARGDFPAAQQHYRSALSLEPGQAAATANLRLVDTAGQVPAQLEPPRLAYPGTIQIYRAVGGTWSQDLATLFTRPWEALIGLPLRLSPLTLNVLVVLYLLSLAITLLWMLIPRPRAAGLPPRPWAFRVLSVLVPGLGLVDEVWGVLLLLPWCGVLLFALSKVLILDFPALPFWRSDLGGHWWVLLSALYALNVLGIVLEEVAYGNRVRRLTKAQELEERRQGAQRRQSEAAAQETPQTTAQTTAPLSPDVLLERTKADSV